MSLTLLEKIVIIVLGSFKFLAMFLITFIIAILVQFIVYQLTGFSVYNWFIKKAVFDQLHK